MKLGPKYASVVKLSPMEAGNLALIMGSRRYVLGWKAWPTQYGNMGNKFNKLPAYRQLELLKQRAPGLIAWRFSYLYYKAL